MKIIVNLDSGSDFITYLIHQIELWLKDNVDKDKLERIQAYVDSESKYNSIYTSKIDLYNLCLSSFLILTATQYRYFYEIEFDKNSIVYGTNIKVIELINLINYGNMNVKPYPIFTEMFDFFNKNLDVLKDKYILGIGE